MSQPWKTDQWFTSSWNHADEVRANLQLSSRLQIHDVTLRDGEQQSGIVLDAPQRLAIARQLAAAGVHRIETGMPAESAEDAALLEILAGENLGVQLMAFSRCDPKHVQIARAHGATGIVVKTITSKHLLREGAQRSVQWAIDTSIEAIAAARQGGLYCVLFTIDATRTDFPAYLEFLEKVCDRASPDAIAVADSYGVALPGAIAFAVRELRKHFKQPIEIHCHNDFGLATACTLAGVAAGAEVAHVTVCGLGERAGNASLEETVMALRCLYGIDPNIRTEMLYDLSRMVQERARFSIPSNRAIVGNSLYSIETDVVAELHRRCKRTPLEYLPFLPEMAGRPGVEIALGKGSGKANVAEHLDERGLKLSAPLVDKLVTQVRDRSRYEKRLLTAVEFDALISRVQE